MRTPAESGASSRLLSAQAGMRQERAKSSRHEHRCDRILQKLVEHGDKWGRVQEQQARFCDANREMLKKNGDIRRQTLESLPKGDFIGSKGRQFLVPMVSQTDRLYETAHNQGHFVKERTDLSKLQAKSKWVIGNERYRKISHWGAPDERRIEINDR